MSRHLGILVLVAAAACGDNLVPELDAPEPAAFEVVGHADLGARGMNAALAVAGDIVYVGSRNDQSGVAIVDVSNPRAPVVVGEIGPPDEHLPSMSSRELRAIPERNLLVVLNMVCSPALHGCAQTGGEFENLKFYDITDRRNPVLLGRHDVYGTLQRPRGPHEFFLRDDGTRVLVFIAAPPRGISFEVIDITDPATPVLVAQVNLFSAGIVARDEETILHSVSISDDGRAAYLSHQNAGLLVADISALPALTLLTPPTAGLTWPPIESVGPHSAVPIPGRDVLVVTEEIYPMPFSTGCPWGHLRTVDVSDPVTPRILGEFKLPQNDPAYCAGNPVEDIAFTAHNTTTTPNLALVTWYSGGLLALDVSNPAAPTMLAQFLPTPLPSVAVEDPALGGNPVTMWSYPVLQDGLIYVTDIRNGLYILRYSGPHDGEIPAAGFREGNSSTR
jgi:hypothetical protein